MTTYTVEPFDFDGTLGLSFSVTAQQFGGRYGPYEKIPYHADGFHNQEGADAIYAATEKMVDGDILMGFSLGVQVISLFLSQHELPKGVKVILAGDTFARNQVLVDQGEGIPWDIDNEVIMVVNEYDGWSDGPDRKSASGYYMAVQNALAGCQRLHYYANADIDAEENVRETRGNITSVLIPTQTLPQNDWLRPWAAKYADSLDKSQRASIDNAYSRVASTPAARAAAASQQVPQPNPAWKV